jgi:hypothetical protein
LCRKVMLSLESTACWRQGILNVGEGLLRTVHLLFSKKVNNAWKSKVADLN